MVSGHLLRPMSPTQLSLAESGPHVVVFVTQGGPNGFSIHGPTLVRRLRDLNGGVAVVAIIDQPVPDPATVTLLDDMIEICLRDGSPLVAMRPVVEACKRVDGDRVIESLDRSTLVEMRLPLVLPVTALRACSHTEDLWVDIPSTLVEQGIRLEGHHQR